jgi:hypothetical protein
MRKIDTNSFNEMLKDKLNDLDRMVSNLTPEHLKQFPEELLKRLAEVDSARYKYAAEASINGVSADKLNGMISYLKAFKHEYVTVTREIAPQLSTVAGDNYALEIDTPEGYDGRNSFVYTYYPNYCWVHALRQWGDPPWKRKFWVIRNEDSVTIQYASLRPTTRKYVTALFWRVK